MLSRLIKVTIALGTLVGCASATTYAQFCNDANCSEGCGISASTDNPGCLGEYGRLSVLYHDINAQDVRLISSPDGGCSCQNYCYPYVVQTLQGGTHCMPLDGPAAQSFRFVGGGSCDANQC